MLLRKPRKKTPFRPRKPSSFSLSFFPFFISLHYHEKNARNSVSKHRSPPSQDTSTNGGTGGRPLQGHFVVVGGHPTNAATQLICSRWAATTKADMSAFAALCCCRARDRSRENGGSETESLLGEGQKQPSSKERELAQKYYLKAAEYQSQGELSKAISHLLQAVKLDARRAATSCST